MKEGLYVHVDDVRDVIDTFGAKGGLPNEITMIDEDYVLGEIKERAVMYVTGEGNLIIRSFS